VSRRSSIQPGRFLAIARDPRIIPGVHHYCDDWCDYCPVTQRCLAFRCAAEVQRDRGGDPSRPKFDDIEDAIAFTREIAATEGASTDALDALVSRPPGHSGIDTDDPLAGVAWEYAMEAASALGPFARSIAADSPTPNGPSPWEILLWYHLRIYMKLFRALVARERSAVPLAARPDEAVGCAKLALTSVQRSRDALRALDDTFERAHRELLERLLDTLERGIDERFPAAREFTRVGIDVPAAA
jgi:hypothetical protein